MIYMIIPITRLRTYLYLYSFTSFFYGKLRNLSHRALRSVINFDSFFCYFRWRCSRAKPKSLWSPFLRKHSKFETIQLYINLMKTKTISLSPYSSRHLNEKPDFEKRIDRKRHEIVSANMTASIYVVSLPFSFGLSSLKQFRGVVIFINKAILAGRFCFSLH